MISDVPTRIRTVQKLTRFLRAGKIYDDEFTSTVIIYQVDMSQAEVEESVAHLDQRERQILIEYARAYFQENGFRPRPFLVDYRDPEVVERKTDEMQPRWERLMEYLEKCLG